jgi:hypothetical protein
MSIEKRKLMLFFAKKYKKIPNSYNNLNKKTAKVAITLAVL